MNKCYYRIVWENYPSDRTPLNEQNLNKIDVATDEMDNRIISLDANKFDKSEAQLLVKYIEYTEGTGVFKITHYNGSSYKIDTLLEKLAINFDYDYQAQRLIITLSDGTVKYVDLSALITQYEFLDSDTVRFTVDATGKVRADVIDGSIQEKHLRPDYLADIKVVEEKAKADAAASAQSARESDGYAKLSKSYAVGTNGEVREGDATDNAKYYCEQTRDIAEVQNAALDTKVSRAGDTMTGDLEVAGTVTAEEFAGNVIGNATSSTRLKTAQNINGISFNGTYNVINYAVCSTEADVPEKTVECSGFSLITGAEITVKFTVTNTAANPTLNVNNTGAKPVYYWGASIGASILRSNSTLTFRYNGAQYDYVGEHNTNTWVSNTATRAGYVASPNSAANKVWGTDEDGNPGWQDKTAGSGGAVTGVKGGAESRYRTGNVNITPANVGAVNKAGDTMTGNLIIGGHGGTNTPAIGWEDKLHFLWAGIKNDEGMFFFWDDTRQENIISKATNGHGEAWGGNHVAIFTNSEGGNIMIEGPSNTQHWEMDNWNDNQFRIYCREGSANYFPFTLSKDGIIGRLIGTADNALRLKDAGGSLYNIGAQYSGELSSAEWLCAWHDLGNNDIRIRAVKNSNISVGWASASQNSNTCGGLFPDHNVSVNSIVTRNASGFSFFNYINSNTSNNENPVISQVIVTNGGDGYYRKASLAHLKSALGIQGYLPLIGGHITGEVTMAASLFVNYVRPQNGSTLHLMGSGFLNLRSPGIQCRNWDDTGWSGISASGFHNQSSCRYKKNIMPMAKERAEKILGVEVCTYDYKDNIVDENQHNRTGVIAERVAEIVPEAVSYREIDGLGNVPDSVDYTRFIPYLIKMTQMQQKEIEKLKSDKQRMEERLDTIEETLGIAGKDGTT